MHAVAGLNGLFCWQQRRLCSGYAKSGGSDEDLMLKTHKILYQSLLLMTNFVLCILNNACLK